LFGAVSLSTPPIPAYIAVNLLHSGIAMLRTLLAALLLAVPLALPAAAAESDVRLIQSFAGDWLGKGRISGGDGGNLECRMSMKANGAKLFYNGRCAIDGQGTQNFQGAIGYNADLNRYEARSGNSPLVIGRRSGGGVVFSFSDEDDRGSVASTITLGSNSIRLAFTLKDGETGETVKASIPFRKN
jgi:hypothetical protein